MVLPGIKINLTDVTLTDHIPQTDPAGWRLVVGQDSHGQHKWVYLNENDPRRSSWAQSTVDKYWLGLDINAKELPKAKTPIEAARNGFEFYKQIQCDDGHWAGAYGGPLFLIPGLVIGLYVTRNSLRPEQKIEMVRYLLRKRKPEGGWGLHTSAPPTTFGTVMNYVSLRLLGMDAEERVMVDTRAWIHKMGGAVCVPTWAKVWLCVLNAYDWSGVNPVPPELWLLPEWVPFHPSRWWVQNRNVYIPIGYLYGTKFRGPLTPLVEQIKEEIYTEPYQNIDFSRHRNNVHSCDVFYPRHPVGKLVNKVALVCEYFVPSLLRRKALDITYKLMVYEDENTQYQTIAPVSKMLNMVCRFAAEGPDSNAFKQHLAKIDDFLWMGEEGLMMTGTNGSQLWDLAFISQAIVESGLAEEEANKESCSRALDWLDKAQIRNDPKWFKEAYRHRSKGAWPFSTPEQGYMVSDCAGEGLKAVLALQSLTYLSQKVHDRRLEDCVDLLLTMQNTDGGFASYELVRGSKWLEWLSNSEVFGATMVEHAYPDGWHARCTTSAVSALLQFSKYDAVYRKRDIEHTVEKAVFYLHGAQKADGSWYGSWGICFTYATMFALEALGLAGEIYSNSASVRKACAFLVGHQMMDGGWGETYLSCVKDKYSQHETSQVVQTSWAILGLIYARYPDKQVIRRACQLIMNRQQPDGSWLQEDAEGIFNKNCVIDYPNYKFSFPIWALGKASEYLASCEALGKE